MTWKLKVTDGTHIVAEKEVTGTIAPGETRYYNHTGYALYRGERTFTVTLDIEGDVDEMDEDQTNTLTTVVTVKAKKAWIQWWMVAIAIAVILVGYVVYMKYTRGEWGYEPVQRWWEKRNS